MSIELIQARINEEADKEALAIVTAAFAPAKAVEDALWSRYPNSFKWDIDKIYIDVYVEEIKGRVKIRVNDDLLKMIEGAVFGAARANARRIHTEEFVEKVRKVS